MRLILASRSPRRAEILRAAGIPCEVQPAAVPEQRLANEKPEAMAERLAVAKAKQVVARLNPDPRVYDQGWDTETSHEVLAIVLGADTVVALEGEIFGKPGTAEQARAMLRQLRGREHRVVTGVAAISVTAREIASGQQAISEKLISGQDTTRVWFGEMTEEDIEDYVASGEPLDKAGGYAIQGLGSIFVARIEGCYFNVVGLPIARVWRMLRELGYQAR